MPTKSEQPKKKKIYHLPTGIIAEDDISGPVLKAMCKARTNRQSQRRKDRRYRDDREFIDGETETHARTLYAQDPVPEAIEALEISAKVQQALTALSETQERRIRLYYFVGFNKREIAEMEGVSHQNVSKSIKRALRILKKVLK